MKPQHLKQYDECGYLTALGIQEKRYGRWYEKMECFCGTQKFIRRSHLLDRTITSCGCMMNIKHGLHGTRFYRIRTAMLHRTQNERCRGYKNYGGRGIIICDKRENFLGFKEDMKESYDEHVLKYGKKDTTIDRIDNDGNYCKENCRRATMKEQSNNRRPKCR